MCLSGHMCLAVSYMLPSVTSLCFTSELIGGTSGAKRLTLFLFFFLWWACGQKLIHCYS